ncbi:hypothetical protein GJ744_012040 [Endocarpon pusillum]|uniref:Ribosomal RNA methyltransferase FtsJ domain-containing protein n=1 Tax=Endocarpon pusillum TaxID=364733 RepID=A0A8H7E8A8_9EURO|nr:hypothetical protein GJ744_012040 [Endocarpon pusillum]
MPEDTENLSVLQRNTEMVGNPREHQIIEEYLSKREPVFHDLCELKKQGWASAEGDKVFDERKRKADSVGPEGRQSFFLMTVRIGDEMARRTNVFRFDNQSPLVLDLCMAPGGFTQSVLKRYPDAHVHAITLPPEEGGYPVIANHPNLSIVYADITLYATDFGVTEIPVNHPDPALFSHDRPYQDCRYDLVFCGGAVLRAQPRAEYRKVGEQMRLTVSQLIFAFQRIKPGGTIVLLLRKIEAWDTVRILHTFSKFAAIKLFKPYRAHAIKSTFYLVAQSILPKTQEAVKALEEWKTLWYEWTFGVGGETSSIPAETGSGDGSEVTEILEEYGTRLVELGRPIWKVQANALRNSGFIKSCQDNESCHDQQPVESLES